MKLIVVVGSIAKWDEWKRKLQGNATQGRSRSEVTIGETTYRRVSHWHDCAGLKINGFELLPGWVDDTGISLSYLRASLCAELVEHAND